MSDKDGEKRHGGLIITVSGLHGSGRSTHAKRLADAFELGYISAGVVFRRLAEEREIPLEEMLRLAEEDPDLDRLVDERTREIAKGGDVVIDGDLSAWMVEDADIKFFLTAPVEARIRRIAARDGVALEEAREATLLRDEIDPERYREYYGIDFGDLSIYDVVLNTELFTPDGTAGILKRVVEEYRSGR